MELTIPNIFANGTGEANIIDAPKMNANFSAVVTVLNGNIDTDNIKAGSAIAIKNIAQTVSAIWTFSANPVFNAGGIADTALSSNIPKKDAANSFSAKQTFSAKIDMGKTEIEQPVIHKLASAPESPVAGQIYFSTTDNHPYIWTGSEWVRLDYIGDYTGGAVRSYSNDGIADDGDSFKMLFKTEGESPTVKIFIKGEPFPKRFYTELGYHTHVFTGIEHDHTVNESNHRHWVGLGTHGHGSTQYSISNHTHGVSGNTGSPNQSHFHGAIMSGSSTSAADAPAHTHSISITSSGPNNNQAIPNSSAIEGWSNYNSTGLTINTKVAEGTNAYAGVNAGTLSSIQKLYGKSLTVTIDGTNVTSNILSATGWSVIGDGTDSHAFHATGTGELNASAWKAYTAGYHTLEIIEPESNYGCGILVHIETS